jgi:hypothetical protein
MTSRSYSFGAYRRGVREGRWLEEKGEGIAVRDADVRPVVLPEPEHEEILASQILPAWTRGAAPAGAARGGAG